MPITAFHVNVSSNAQHTIFTSIPTNPMIAAIIAAMMIIHANALTMLLLILFQLMALG